MRGYGSHLIIKEVGTFEKKVSVIANGLEKYMAFTTNKNFVFIESMQFMNSSLNSLVKNFSSDDFKYLSEECSGQLLELVKEKGLYAYKYMDSFEKFSENTLPDKCKIFSALKGECISEKDYERANNIWNALKINSMKEYHDLYLKTGVLLLADIFEKFIKTCLDYYGLDTCHYFSSHGLSRDAMLKVTGVELELIHEIDMHLFIQKGMRGGISYITKRHNKTSNKYMESYDSSEGSIFIMYLDSNNVYGWTVTQYLPYGKLNWLNRKEIDRFDVNSISENSSIGYMLDVDLEYPSKLHDSHNNYPLARNYSKCFQITVLTLLIDME